MKKIYSYERFEVSVELEAVGKASREVAPAELYGFIAVVQVVLAQIAGVAENFPINKVTLFIEQDRVPDRWCSGVNAIHQFDA